MWDKMLQSSLEKSTTRKSDRGLGRPSPSVVACSAAFEYLGTEDDYMAKAVCEKCGKFQKLTSVKVGKKQMNICVSCMRKECS